MTEFHDVRSNYYQGGPGHRPECLTCGWVGPVSYDAGVQSRLDGVEHSRIRVIQDV